MGGIEREKSQFLENLSTIWIRLIWEKKQKKGNKKGSYQYCFKKDHIHIYIDASHTLKMCTNIAYNIVSKNCLS